MFSHYQCKALIHLSTSNHKSTTHTMRANMKAATIATVLLLATSASADKVTANAKDLQDDSGKVAADAKGVLEGLAERVSDVNFAAARCY
jgi:hypothetical protein